MLSLNNNSTENIVNEEFENSKMKETKSNSHDA